jgi:hypothetical protein
MTLSEIIKNTSTSGVSQSVPLGERAMDEEQSSFAVAFIAATIFAVIVLWAV